MKSITAVTVGLPRILRDILSDAIDENGRVELLAHLDSFSDLTDSQISDCVVIARQDLNPERVLRKNGNARIMSIENHGDTIYLWELVPRMTSLGSVSPRQLVEHMALENMLSFDSDEVH